MQSWRPHEKALCWPKKASYRKINAIKKDILHLEKKIQKIKNLPHAQQEFSDMFSKVGNNIGVHDHCRYTGKYRGTAHIIFNLR